MQVLENAQRRATRMVPELRGMSYRERLMELNLSTLEYMRKRYDSIQVFKIVHKIDDIDMNKFFTFTDNSQLRGHNLKLTKPRVNKSIRLNSFPMRNIQVWNPGNYLTSTNYEKSQKPEATTKIKECRWE